MSQRIGTTTVGWCGHAVRGIHRILCLLKALLNGRPSNDAWDAQFGWNAWLMRCNVAVTTVFGGGLTERERRAMRRRYSDVDDWFAWLSTSQEVLAEELREAYAPKVLSLVRA